MLGYAIPDELIVSVLGIVVIALVRIGIAISKVHERLARIEEDIRQYERRRNGIERGK